MKRAIRSMVPESALHVARRAYRGVFKADHSAQARFAHTAALQCTVSYNKYGGYCVPWSSRHRPAAQRVLAQEVYEPQTIEFMCAHCADGDIIHAGTFFGDFLPALSRAVARGSRILAFEPNMENYRCARITVEINACANIMLGNAALGAGAEELQLRTVDSECTPLGGASHIIDGGLTDMDHTQPVRVVTIDSTVEPGRPVSIIQLDVEGYEKEALSGALETIRRCHPIIILEVWTHSRLLDSSWFRENILSLGYRHTLRLHGNMVFEFAGRVDAAA
ncbi:MAG TPA: FkbM family methyltransferase [Rhodanobacteraceae bacterium]|nr:FkbM family methyltransferase [Rhodanobacteraceae bacterium]